MQGCIYAYIALPLTFLYLLDQILYTTDLMLVVHKSRNKNKRENLFFTYYIICKASYLMTIFFVTRLPLCEQYKRNSIS